MELTSRRAWAAIWERSPAVILTRGIIDGEPKALAWLPGDDGRWLRASLLTFDDAGGLLTLVQIADDPEVLERVEAEDPMGEPLDDEHDWSQWDRGESSADAGGSWPEGQLLHEETPGPI